VSLWIRASPEERELWRNLWLIKPLMAGRQLQIRPMPTSAALDERIANERMTSKEAQMENQPTQYK
jgi:hypothetical protein